MRREQAEKLKRLDELKQGRPEEMTVINLRQVLKEMEVPFRISDKKDVFVLKFKNRERTTIRRLIVAKDRCQVQIPQHNQHKKYPVIRKLLT